MQAQGQAVSYIKEIVDRHRKAGLLESFRGMHLRQSLAGELAKRTMKNPSEPADDYDDKLSKTFLFSFEVGKHQPFTDEGVEELLYGLPLEFLTFEFLTKNRWQHVRYIAEQRFALRQFFGEAATCHARRA